MELRKIKSNIFQPNAKLKLLYIDDLINQVMSIIKNRKYEMYPKIKKILAGNKFGLMKIENPKNKEHKKKFSRLLGLLSKAKIPYEIPIRATKYPIHSG